MRRYEDLTAREPVAQKGLSEHLQILGLGKNGSHIGAVTNGSRLASVKGSFSIITYLEINPAEFLKGWTMTDPCGHGSGKS